MRSPKFSIRNPLQAAADWAERLSTPAGYQTPPEQETASPARPQPAPPRQNAEEAPRRREVPYVVAQMRRPARETPREAPTDEAPTEIPQTVYFTRAVAEEDSEEVSSPEPAEAPETPVESAPPESAAAPPPESARRAVSSSRIPRPGGSSDILYALWGAAIALGLLATAVSFIAAAMG